MIWICNTLFRYRQLIKLRKSVLVLSEFIMSQTISAVPLSCVSAKLLHCVYGCVSFMTFLVSCFVYCLADLFCVDAMQGLTAINSSPAQGSDRFGT